MVPKYFTKAQIYQNEINKLFDEYTAGPSGPIAPSLPRAPAGPGAPSVPRIPTGPFQKKKNSDLNRI